MTCSHTNNWQLENHLLLLQYGAERCPSDGLQLHCIWKKKTKKTKENERRKKGLGQDSYTWTWSDSWLKTLLQRNINYPSLAGKLSITTRHRCQRLEQLLPALSENEICAHFKTKLSLEHRSSRQQSITANRIIMRKVFESACNVTSLRVGWHLKIPQFVFFSPPFPADTV